MGELENDQAILCSVKIPEQQTVQTEAITLYATAACCDSPVAKSFRSTAPSHCAMTMVASALPRILTATKADESSRCTPRISPTAATGIVPVAARGDTRTSMA